MDMKISSAVVKSLREKKLWSQQELATACGVSLRTIQRLEGEGKASPETVKALAAVFAVEHEILRENSSVNGDYINLQLGTALLSVFIGATFFLVYLLSQAAFDGRIFLFGMAINGLICSLFATLTTRVNSNFLEWHFSFGFLKKSIPLEQIMHCEVVRNKVWWGLGIRLIPDGWLYSVSGLDAVAIHLANEKKYRIGTDDPERFCQAIKNAIRRKQN